MTTIELPVPTAPPVVEPMLTYGDVAEALKVSPSTVKKLCKDGDLKAVNVGRQVRIRARDLQTYIDGLDR